MNIMNSIKCRCIICCWYFCSNPAILTPVMCPYWDLSEHFSSIIPHRKLTHISLRIKHTVCDCSKTTQIDMCMLTFCLNLSNLSIFVYRF